MSCGRIALDRAGIRVYKYYASEIDKYAQQVSEKNYPDIIRLGDITKWQDWDIKEPIDLILAGSPCQGFSFSGKQLNFKDPRSALFFVFVDILKHYKPKWFLLENVVMKAQYNDVISSLLGEGEGEGVDLTFPTSKTRRGRRMEDKCNALTAATYDYNFFENKTVRRLTPTECERLQTVPDGYTTGVSDSQRYKMLGNGWTVDVISCILQSISYE